MVKISNEYILYNGDIKNTDEFEVIKPVSSKQIYEVIRIINKKPLFLKEHIERLINSVKITDSNCVVTTEIIKDEIEKLVKVNNVTEGNVKIILDNSDRYMFFIPHSYPSQDLYINGVKTILYFGERENPNAKVINDTFRERVNRKLDESNSYEAILVDRNGYITEGSRSNIFMVIDGKIVTSPGSKVLPGITRMKIIQCCNELGLEIEEKELYYKQLDKIEGAFISGTSPKVLPIKSIDELKINSQKNKIINDIKNKFDELIKKDIS
ncbi:MULTISPECIES: aminotransferase class IV [Clostridium]|uniref:Aminotransferase class IV n=1 Tax=Clostridium senegalense TaxID=1465809 RepID=A0A6M0H0R6_9CLOT|nr:MULTISPECIES: aminotransferase class IV [Clostridium]NEU03471.1 aminotransferase class IV [Clostridium senegalense]